MYQLSNLEVTGIRTEEYETEIFIGSIKHLLGFCNHLRKVPICGSANEIRSLLVYLQTASSVNLYM